MEPGSAHACLRTVCFAPSLDTALQRCCRPPGNRERSLREVARLQASPFLGRWPCWARRTHSHPAARLTARPQEAQLGQGCERRDAVRPTGGGCGNRLQQQRCRSRCSIRPSRPSSLSSQGPWAAARGALLGTGSLWLGAHADHSADSAHRLTPAFAAASQHGGRDAGAAPGVPVLRRRRLPPSSQHRKDAGESESERRCSRAAGGAPLLAGGSVRLHLTPPPHAPPSHPLSRRARLCKMKTAGRGWRRWRRWCSDTWTRGSPGCWPAPRSSPRIVTCCARGGEMRPAARTTA